MLTTRREYAIISYSISNTIHRKGQHYGAAKGNPRTGNTRGRNHGKGYAGVYKANKGRKVKGTANVPRIGCRGRKDRRKAMERGGKE